MVKNHVTVYKSPNFMRDFEWLHPHWYPHHDWHILTMSPLWTLAAAETNHVHLRQARQAGSVNTEQTDTSIVITIIFSIIYLSIYLSIDRSIYLSIYVSIYLSIYRSIYLSVYIYLYKCLRMYVCTYVRMYVCTYARMCVCTYVRMYACTPCTHVRMYVCTFVRMYVCTYVRMYVCTYVRMYVCTYARMCVCTYVRMYACTHVRMYFCTYVRMYFCTYAHMYLCTYVRTYVNVCIYIEKKRNISIIYILLLTFYLSIVLPLLPQQLSVQSLQPRPVQEQVRALPSPAAFTSSHASQTQTYGGFLSLGYPMIPPSHQFFVGTVHSKPSSYWGTHMT